MLTEVSVETTISVIFHIALYAATHPGYLLCALNAKFVFLFDASDFYTGISGKRVSERAFTPKFVQKSLFLKKIESLEIKDEEL